MDWFKILSENYMQTKERPLEYLDMIAEQYPIVMHGMSIGGVDPLGHANLKKLKELRERTNAKWVNVYLCFTGVLGKNTHDFLQLRYNEESLLHVATRVREVQDFMEAPLALENPSSYLELTAFTMSEHHFLAELAREADCALLLDVNNVFVSAYNHDFEPAAYFAALPWDR